MTVVLSLDERFLPRVRGEPISEVRQCRVPAPDADHVFPEGGCPACGHRSWRVSCAEPREVDDRLLVARARCRECEATWVGDVVVSGLTLFGFDEDRRVLSGRYGRVF